MQQTSDSGNEWDAVWINAHLATMEPTAENPLGLFRDGAVAVKDGRIVWVGPMSDLRDQPALADAQVHDCKSKWLTPGLIDSHTHLVYAGNRAKEFARRLAGESYAEIAASGGGIMSTVSATRAASEDALIEQTIPRLERLIGEGVTTIEIKSGYGLDTKNELKMLRVARRLGEWQKVRIRTTFLAAHALPPEFAGKSDDYITHICEEMLPAAVAEGLVDAVDGFCEHLAFSNVQMRRVFEAARRHKLPVKLHAEQLSNQHGAELVAEFGGLSADHIEYLDEAGVKAMAAAGTVGTLLPAAFYFLRETQKPPIELMREHGVAMAVATDSNPGTAPIETLLLTLNMACICFGLTIPEALLGVTRHAAKALGADEQLGSVSVGKVADFAIWNVSDLAELPYRIGTNPLSARIFAGQRTDRLG